MAYGLTRTGAWVVRGAALIVLSSALAAAQSSSPPIRKAEAAKPDSVPTFEILDPGAEESAGPPRTHAVLINGGSSAARNYLSHFHHLQDMMAALRARGIPPERITVFSADGEDPGKDMAARGGEPENFWLAEGTNAGRALNAPDLTNTKWEGVTLRPARLRDLRKWFKETGNKIPPGDTLLVFVTDHGNLNADDPDNGTISLWNGTLSVMEFRALLEHLKPGVRAVSVMSQCYSGAFAEAMAPFHSRVPGGDVCGFYSTTSDRPAYGCYAEGRDRDRIGHAFRFIDAMSSHAETPDIHAAVLVTDTTPDLPVRTSDLFLERILNDEAARRKLTLDDLVDQQLVSAWSNRGRWERDIRLLDRIGQVYGTFSPRMLSELKQRLDSLEALSKELGTYADRWKLALDDLRRDNMERFVEAEPAWKERLESKRIEDLNESEKRRMLLDLLAALEEFTKGRPDVWSRLQELRKLDEDANSAQYRTDIRLAALMRMRTLLVRIAGVQLLSEVDEAREEIPSRGARWRELKHALAKLEECEGRSLGTLDPSQDMGSALATSEPLPSFEQDLETVKRALPSWLGVRFRPVTEAQRNKYQVERGATVMEVVFPEGPAGAAGMQPGDIVLGPPGAHFAEPTQIREWTMTSPRGKPLPLDLIRESEPLEVEVVLAPYPAEFPELPPPPKAGDPAPRIGSLKVVRWTPKPHDSTGDSAAEADGSDEKASEEGDEDAAAEDEGVKDVANGPHMLFFWATWCGPCKAAVPELLAWSKKSGIPVVAVSDEDETTVRKFLESWKTPFPELVASDELRGSHLGYGVSGTPTFVLIDEKGTIEWRHVGYSTKDRLGIPGWNWSGKTN